MPKVLHIFKQKPDAATRELAACREGEKNEIHLYHQPDYQRLLEEVFRADKVICWW